MKFALNVHRYVAIRQLMQNSDLSETDGDQYEMRPLRLGIRGAHNFTLVSHFQVNGPRFEFFDATTFKSHFYPAHLLI